MSDSGETGCATLNAGVCLTAPITTSPHNTRGACSSVHYLPTCVLNRRPEHPSHTTSTASAAATALAIATSMVSTGCTCRAEGTSS